MTQSKNIKRNIRNWLAILVAVVIVAWTLRIIQTTIAGSLTPAAPPGVSMKNVSDVLAPLSSGSATFSATANKNGNALQIIQCAISNLKGTPCQ